MLSESTVQYLSAMHYCADAKRKVCYLPLAGIYWDDELTDMRDIWKFGESDRDRFLTLFGIRVRIWMEQTLSTDECTIWGEAQTQLPNWALFRRLDPSEDDLRHQAEADEYADAIIETMTEGADLVSVYCKNGLTKYSAITRLDKEKRNSPRDLRNDSLWTRLFGTK